MTARTDIAPPLARIAIAIADYLIALTEDQRDDVIVRALCVVEEGSPAADRPIPYVPTQLQPPVTACDDVPEPSTPMRPSPRRVSARRLEASTVIEAAAKSIVAVLSDHPEGLTKRALAVAVNLPVGEHRFKAALDSVVHSGRVRAQGNTFSRRYMPAGK
jgi:hypothetical protein